MNLLSRIYEKVISEKQQHLVVVPKETVVEEKQGKKDVPESLESLPAGSLKIVKGLHKSK